MFLSVLWPQLVRMISNILVASNGSATLLESCSCSFEVSTCVFTHSSPKLNTTFMITLVVEVGIGFQFQYNLCINNMSHERSSSCQIDIGGRKKKIFSTVFSGQSIDVFSLIDFILPWAGTCYFYGGTYCVLICAGLMCILAFEDSGGTLESADTRCLQPRTVVLTRVRHM